MRTEEEIRREVEEDFARLEAGANPGVLMALQVYGEAERVYEEAKAYLSPADDVLALTNTNSAR